MKKLAVTIASISATALLGTTWAEQARAQEAGLEQVIVTARKTEENIQSIPVAITSLSADALAKNNIFNVKDVTAQTPSLTVTAASGTSSTARINIRGQVQNDTIFTVDPSVGVYLDEVYLGRAQGALLDMYDVARVEILKGPQGTLYGRNTTGGALKIITNKADAGAGVTGYMKGGFGNYDAKRVEGGINIPLIEDKLAVRIAGLVNKRDGYATQTVVDPTTLAVLETNHPNDKNSESARINIVLNATDDLDFEFAGDYSDINTHGALAYNARGDVAGGNLSSITGGNPFVWANYGTFTRSSSDPLKATVNTNSNVENGVDKARSSGGSVTANYTISNDLALKLVFAHREVNSAYTFDVDGTNMPINNTSQSPSARQDSIELQLTGTSFDNSLDWVAGLYGFKETGAENSDTFAFGSAPGYESGAVNLLQAGKGENKSKSIYGQGTYHLTDTVSLTAGARWTGDTKSWTGTNLESIPLLGIINQCHFEVGSDAYNNGCLSDESKNYKHISWTAGIDWQMTDDVLVYLKSSNGYRAGGQNMRGVDADTLEPFDQETVTDIEAGLKSTLWDNRLRLNTAVYHSFYSAFQNSVFVIVGGNAVTKVVNLGKADIDGVEVEANVMVVDNLVLNLSGSYLDVQYEKSGLQASFSPRWKYAIGGTYTQYLDIGELSYNVNYAWTDKFAANTDKHVNETPNAWSEAIGLLNARVALEIQSVDLTVGVWGTNLADQRYTSNNLAFSLAPTNPNAYTFVSTAPGEPRMFGVDVTKKF